MWSVGHPYIEIENHMKNTRNFNISGVFMTYKSTKQNIYFFVIFKFDFDKQKATEN